MFLLELILTIVAWIRGWKWRALIPVGSVLVVGFLVGFGAGMAGGNVDLSGFVFLDIAAIIALIVMSIVKPKSKEKEIKK